MSNLIAEIKKEACQQLIIADINKKNYEQQAKEGLKNGILSNMFCIWQSMKGFQHLRYPPVLFDT